MIRDFGLLARGRHRRHLPVLDHPPARDPRHPRVPLPHQRQGLPRGRRSAGSSCSSAASRPAAAIPLAIASVVDLLRGHRRRGQAHAADRSGAVGQPGVAEHQGSARGRGRDELVERARRVRPERRRVLRRVHQVRARLHARAARAAERASCSPVRASRPRSATSSPCPARPTSPPTGDEVQGRVRRSRPKDLQVSTVSPGSTDFNIVFRAGPSSLEDRAPIVKEIRDDTKPPRGSRSRRRASPSSASACSTTSRPIGSC